MFAQIQKDNKKETEEDVEEGYRTEEKKKIKNLQFRCCLTLTLSWLCSATLAKLSSSSSSFSSPSCSSSFFFFFFLSSVLTVLDDKEET